MYDNMQRQDMADILYGSYIRYDRMYEMTKFALYGATDVNHINVYIDCYSILRSLYTRGGEINRRDSYAIASCLINLAIHIRAYFETRHNIMSKVYLIYGRARPRQAIVNHYSYNQKNMFMEDSNALLTSLIFDNLEVMKILCPYLHDIFCIVDMENEFSVIASAIIDNISINDKSPHVIYSKDVLAYQLVAFKPRTCLYRPKKSNKNNSREDNSWVVTKSTLYNAYRYGELGLKKERPTVLDVKMFSIFQAISGVKTRNLNSITNANTTIAILEEATGLNTFANGYNANSIFYLEPNPFTLISRFQDEVKAAEITNRFAAIDLPYQTSLYKASINYMELEKSIINLYNPQEIRNINDRYFTEYPLDLNRV